MLQKNTTFPAESASLLATPSAQDDLDLGWLFGAIRLRLRLIVALMILGTAVAAAYVATRPANYTAFTQLQLTNLRLTFSRDDAFYAESQPDPTFLETQIQIMRSGKIALAVVDSLSLASEAGSKAKLEDASDGTGVSGLVGRLTGPESVFARLRIAIDHALGSDQNAVAASPDATIAANEARREALKQLQRSYWAERVGLSNIVEIRFTAPDRDMAARGANELAQAYIADQQTARVESAQSASIWLRERLKDVGPRTRIVAAAAPPKDKSDPRGVLIIALGCIAGGVVGVGLALLRQLLDRTVRTPEQVEALTGVECLGVVPKLRGGRFGATSAPTDSGAMPVGGRFLNETAAHPFGELSRTLQNAKAAIEDRCVTIGGARCVGVTSTYSGEGVSTVAVNLSRRLADLGERVLLVDCNVARPTLSAKLSPAGALGLYDLDRSKSESVEAFLREDSVSSMKFLALGHRQDERSFWTEATPKFLTSMGRSFDYVICDLPPLASIGEVRAAAPHFDACLLVVQWRSVDLEHLKIGLKTAGVFRNKLVGAIINRAHPASLRRMASPGAAFFLRKPSVGGSRV